MTDDDELLVQIPKLEWSLVEAVNHEVGRVLQRGRLTRFAYQVFFQVSSTTSSDSRQSASPPLAVRLSGVMAVKPPGVAQPVAL